MPTTEELGRLFKRATIKQIRNEEFIALVGRVRSTGNVSVRGSVAFNDALPDDAPWQIYVRPVENPDQVLVANCLNVTPRANATVVCKYNQFDKLTVIRIDDEGSGQTFGASAGALSANITDLDITGAIVGGRNMRPGRLRLSTAGTMEVTADNFLYVDDDGALQYFRANDSVLDLSSNIPGSGLQRYVLVSFDPDPDSPTLVATDGSTSSSNGTLTPQVDGVAITIPDGNIPLALVRVVNGDTLLTEGRFVDWRVWVTEAQFNTHATLFTQTADVTVANTTTETTQLGAGSGSVTIPANLLRVGTHIRIVARGYVSTANPAGTLTLRCYLDATQILATSSFTASNSLSDDGWTLTIEMTCRSIGATGTVVAGGSFAYDTTVEKETNTSAVTVDTTQDLDIDLTAQWGTADAGNTITTQIVTIERLR